MMLIICDKDPQKAVKYLVEHTNKNFVFKQLLELGQLICSAGISDVYKKIPQGKELQEWVKYNAKYGHYMFMQLLKYVKKNINISKETYSRLYRIECDYSLYLFYSNKYTKTAIFRYKKDYKSQYPTNSELPINVAIEEYKKYLEWKIKGE